MARLHTRSGTYIVHWLLVVAALLVEHAKCSAAQSAQLRSVALLACAASGVEDEAVAEVLVGPQSRFLLPGSAELRAAGFGSGRLSRPLRIIVVQRKDDAHDKADARLANPPPIRSALLATFCWHRRLTTIYSQRKRFSS